jgi:hypothetical protein
MSTSAPSTTLGVAVSGSESETSNEPHQLIARKCLGAMLTGSRSGELSATYS